MYLNPRKNVNYQLLWLRVYSLSLSIVGYFAGEMYQSVKVESLPLSTFEKQKKK